MLRRNSVQSDAYKRDDYNPYHSCFRYYRSPYRENPEEDDYDNELWGQFNSFEDTALGQMSDDSLLR